MTRALALCLLLLGAMPLPGWTAPLDLPVWRPGEPMPRLPAYRGDRLSLELSPEVVRIASARASAAGGMGRVPVASLGIPALDRAALAVGGATFEPEFQVENASSILARYFLVELPDGADLVSALARFRGVPEVLRASPIPIVEVTAAHVAPPNDSLANPTGGWWMAQPSGHHIHALEAWDRTVGDDSVTVAILDTGVIPYHPDLGGRGPQEPGHFWINAPEKDGVAGVDDDGNGFVDDTHGWDFVALPSTEGAATGEDVILEDNDPNDYPGHGTSVAGLVGALTDNQIGIASVAWRVRLMPLRVGWAWGDRPGGVIDMSYLARAIRYATRMGAHVINLSTSTYALPALASAVTEAVAAGVVVVSAAGNNGSSDFIGDIPGVITVTATDRDDVVPAWANRGPQVDLAAPGAAIATTNLIRQGADSLGLRQGGYVLDANGTSFATPLVSGAAALVQSLRRATSQPLFSSERMRRLLMGSADDLRDQNPGLTGYGAGRLNLARALEHAEGVRIVTTARTDVEAAALLPSGTGPPWLATTALEGKIVFSRTPGLDSLDAVTLPGVPLGSIAAADLGGGRGLSLFIALRNGSVAGFTGSGRPLPGWPVSTLGTFPTGVVIGDLDGDGEMEIVCADAATRVWAWEGDGRRRAGFPKALIGTRPIGLLPLLADLDGEPGAEIVVAQGDGHLLAIDGQAQVLPGWPLPTSLEPVHALLAARDDQGPLVLAASLQSVRGIRPSGALAFRTPITAMAPVDMALADLDGDGRDEVIVRSASGADAMTLSGTRLSGEWPRSGDSTPSAVIVVGGEGANRTIVTMARDGYLALDPDGHSLPHFLPFSVIGRSPTLAVIAGRRWLFTGPTPDGFSYAFDMGTQTQVPWPTYRGSFARTGSRTDTPPMAEIAPDPVSHLTAGRSWESGVELNWHASGDDGRFGNAQHYLVVAKPLEGSGEVVSQQWTIPGGVPSGTAVTAAIEPLAHSRGYRFTVTAVDAGGQSSLAASIEARTDVIPPPPIARAELALRSNPGVPPVMFQWRLAGGAPTVAPRLRVYDPSGRRRVDLDLPKLQEGSYSWDGRDENGQSLPAGLYFAELSTTRPEARVKVVLLAPR